MKNLNSKKLIRYSSLVVLVFALIYILGWFVFPGELIIVANCFMIVLVLVWGMILCGAKQMDKEE